MKKTTRNFKTTKEKINKTTKDLGMHLDLETRVNFESTTENYTEVTDMNKDGTAQLLKEVLARRSSYRRTQKRWTQRK